MNCCDGIHPLHTFRILLPIWSVCIDAIRTSLRDLDYKKGTDVALLYQRLATLLDTLKEFFCAGGQGLSDSQMDSDTYGVSHMIQSCDK